MKVKKERHWVCPDCKVTTKPKDWVRGNVDCELCVGGHSSVICPNCNAEYDAEHGYSDFPDSVYLPRVK